MKVAGVIAEYNPFHNGHKYQLDEIRKRTDADYIIVAMSGNFVQRGQPAIIEKYQRASYALMNGADLVIEIPSIYATASASYFAKAGVEALASTGIVDYLCFGGECDSLETLNLIANTLSQNKEELDPIIFDFQKKGLSYPVARAKAISQLMNKDTSNIEEVISSPNNILAIEYLKYLPEGISPILIQRQGDSYNSDLPQSNMASASAIRRLLADKEKIDAYIPDNIIESIYEYKDSFGFVFPDSISSMLGLRLYDSSDFSEIMDCTNDLSDKIINNKNNYRSFTNFCNLLKSKDLTYSRISRVLLAIVLGNTKDLYQYASLNELSAPYIRILGFKKASSQLLSETKKKSSAPLISKMADAYSLLSPQALKLLERDTYSSDIYRILVSANNRTNLLANDFSHSISII